MEVTISFAELNNAIQLDSSLLHMWHDPYHMGHMRPMISYYIGIELQNLESKKTIYQIMTKLLERIFLKKQNLIFSLYLQPNQDRVLFKKVPVSDWFTNNPVTLNVDLSPEDTFHGICLSQRILPS